MEEQHGNSGYQEKENRENNIKGENLETDFFFRSNSVKCQ